MYEKEKISLYIEHLSQLLSGISVEEIEKFITMLRCAREQGNRVFIFGNGGSASTASHMACDFNKQCSCNRERKFKVFCLNDNVATMLAWANDISYNDIFAEQLKNFMWAGDIVIAISASGNSENILRAVEYAKENGAKTVALCGYEKGLIQDIADFTLNVKANDMQKTEDIHLILVHIATQILSQKDD